MEEEAVIGAGYPEPELPHNVTVDPRSDLKEWSPTISAIRDRVLNDVRHGVTCLEPEASDESGYEVIGVERVADFADALNEAVVSGRVIDLDLGSHPLSILNDNQERSVQAYAGNNGLASAHPFSKIWLLRICIDHTVTTYLVDPHDPDMLNGGPYSAAELRPLTFLGSGGYRGGNFFVVSDRIFMTRDSEDPDGTYNTQAWPGFFRYSRKDYGPNWREAHQNAIVAATQMTVLTVLFCLLLLSVAGDHRQKVAASEKLQKARQRSGKPSIPPHERLHIDPYLTEIMARVEKLVPKVTGTHASPIPHLRRGHFRTRNGKRHFVRDALVNHPKDEEFRSSRTNYEIAQSVAQSLTER
jgi:hypothetical protein